MLQEGSLGVVIPVAAWEDLMASKLSARREKDLRILPELEQLHQRQLRGEQTGWPAIEG